MVKIECAIDQQGRRDSHSRPIVDVKHITDVMRNAPQISILGAKTAPPCAPLWCARCTTSEVTMLICLRWLELRWHPVLERAPTKQRRGQGSHDGLGAEPVRITRHVPPVKVLSNPTGASSRTRWCFGCCSSVQSLSAGFERPAPKGVIRQPSMGQSSPSFAHDGEDIKWSRQEQ